MFLKMSLLCGIYIPSDTFIYIEFCIILSIITFSFVPLFSCLILNSWFVLMEWKSLKFINGANVSLVGCFPFFILYNIPTVFSPYFMHICFVISTSDILYFSVGISSFSKLV